MNPATWVERHALQRPDHPAIAHGDTVYATWSQFARTVACAATGLCDEFDLSPGDRVAIVMHNCPEYLEAVCAIWHAGLIVVPVHAQLRREEIAHILADSGSRVVLTDDEHGADIVSLLNQSRAECSAVVVSSPQWERITAAGPSPVSERVATDPAWLYYTSGTTGPSKGVTLTNRNLLAMTLSYFADIDQVSADDSILHIAPLSHGSGFYMLPYVARGATSVIPDSRGVDGPEIASLISRWSRISFVATPALLKLLAHDPAILGADLTNLKTVMYGGAPMSVADLEEALRVFGPRLTQIYGQGEIPMTITSLSKDQHAGTADPRWLDHVQSVGTPRTDVEVIIVDEDGVVVPIGEIGEVAVRGDVVMAGYWNHNASTAETFPKGWLRTGDIGSFDAEGYLTLRDRSADVIIRGGMTIYPREVEAALLLHPAVKSVAIVGRPDSERDESVVAFVVVHDGAVQPTAGELDTVCVETIARYKRPREYRFADSLPTNVHNKVNKWELRELLNTESPTS